MEHNINMACWKMRLQLLSTPCPVYSEHLLIVNGNFAIPSNDGKYDCFHKLIRGTLRVDPSQRFKVWDILERLAAVAETKVVYVERTSPVAQDFTSTHLSPGYNKEN
ncbi:hypothetical protein Pcinc_003784 [Petrolisthes cinctipes]|uniref:Uncharacterized protein n=1 Tax=Petrolisthes cinctipes TaxID=88211 RepID=A0AAE1KK22_PETCI|nr:hypothetical protein Pcinc_020806 [Petrolisthes cinctipes]KAK3877461.1 hypothetical protein Pcinc_017825 [Petrolisthes cinctipes]KAK3892330.1 hypothetical protein Pcinc_003784 [Petrolisthes cinctipes]